MDKTPSSSSKKMIHGISVRFYKRGASVNYTMDFKVRGDRIQETTGWPTLTDAIRVADMRVRQMKEAAQGLTEDAAARLRLTGRFATVREVATAARGGDMTVSDRTLEGYITALRRLAETVDGVNPWDVSLERVLTRATFDALVKARQGGARVNRVDRLKVNTGINSLMRGVAALFGRKHRAKFESLRLPALTALDDWLPLPELDHRFVALPAERYEAMVAAAKDLKAAWPELWVVHMLVRLLGLRNEEVLAARRHWLEERADGVYLRICDRPGEWSLLKHGLPGELWIDPELAVVLKERPAGFLVLPEGSPSARYDLIYRRHNDWLRTFIPRAERTKGAHELRKYVGSVVMMEHGADAARHFLRHKSSRTFEEHYEHYLKPLPKVTTSMIGAA